MDPELDHTKDVWLTSVISPHFCSYLPNFVSFSFTYMCLESLTRFDAHETGLPENLGQLLSWTDTMKFIAQAHSIRGISIYCTYTVLLVGKNPFIQLNTIKCT